jgi:hypothetical protein
MKLETRYILDKIFLQYWDDDILNDMFFYKKIYWDNDTLTRPKPTMVSLQFRVWDCDNLIKLKTWIPILINQKLKARKKIN